MSAVSRVYGARSTRAAHAAYLAAARLAGDDIAIDALHAWAYARAWLAGWRGLRHGFDADLGYWAELVAPGREPVRVARMGSEAWAIRGVLEAAGLE